MKYETLESAQAAGVAPWTDLVWEDFHVCVFRDQYPVTKGHLLYVPKYNNQDIILDCFYSALDHGMKMQASGEWDGFNIGINMGQAAGQTVMYPHVHLIPRKIGDCPDPTGGVRGVIFGQQNYKAAGYQKPD